jgi:hypothetical protein
VVAEAEELTLTILELLSGTTVELAVVVAFIVLGVFCLLYLVVVLLWLATKDPMELIITVILVLQVMVEMAKLRRST